MMQARPTVNSNATSLRSGYERTAALGSNFKHDLDASGTRVCSTSMNI